MKEWNVVFVQYSGYEQVCDTDNIVICCQKIDLKWSKQSVNVTDDATKHHIICVFGHDSRCIYDDLLTHEQLQFMHIGYCSTIY